MLSRKKKIYNDKELLSAIPKAMPTLDEQRSLPLRETAFLTLRKLIVTGKLLPGEKLTEARFGHILGTSRTPVREAFRELALESLVTITPGNGASVAKITEDDLRDAMEVRSTLDRLCASLASARITEEEKKELTKAVDAFEHSVRFGNEQEIVESDARFHDLIARVARNRCLYQVMADLADTIYRYRYEYIRDDLYYKDLIKEHRTICSAILKGNAREASDAAGEHVKRQQEFIIRKMRKSQ